MLSSAPSENGEAAGRVECPIEAARGGDVPALGRVLESCRNYLLLTANEELDAELQAKVGPSDVVQKTYLEACRDFGQFRGRTEADLLAWLRGILLHNLSNIRRDYRGTAKRQLARERPIVAGREGPSRVCLTPGAVLAAQEHREIVIRAVGQLPEHYREVLRLRQHENCSFAQIGERTGRTPEGSRKLWARAIERLKEVLKTSQITH